MRNQKNNFISLLGLVLICLSSEITFAQQTTAPTAQRMVNNKKRPAKVQQKQFIYVNGYYTSFADQVLAKVSGGKAKARSVFQGFGAGGDYTRYIGRSIYGWNLNFLTGTVDIQRVQTINYPRKSFWGLHTGPEIGYRMNADMDLSYSLGVLYRDIESIGASFVLSNQVNIKFRFTPKLTFFQNFGNYGSPKAYSYSIGLRWLL